MTDLNRRMFLASAAAATATRGVPKLGTSPQAKRVLELVYDHSMGMMRAVDRVVFH